jgi:hypothetical protein
VIGRNTRNGTPSIETVPEDSGSFSEIVRAVFTFFARKPERWAICRITNLPSSIDAHTGGNLSDRKINLPNTQGRDTPFGQEEQVLAIQNQRPSKNQAGLKLDLTPFAKGISQRRSQPSYARLALLPPKRKTVG